MSDRKVQSIVFWISISSNTNRWLLWYKLKKPQMNTSRIHVKAENSSLDKVINELMNQSINQSSIIHDYIAKL